VSTTADRTRRGWSRDRFERAFFGVARWVVIVGLLVATVLPFYYMLLLSVRPIQQLLLDPADLVPSLQELTVTTYETVLAPVSSGGQGFLVFLRNSLLVALATVAIGLLAAIPGAYAISRLRFRGSRSVSFLFLAVYLFPPMVLAIPLFSFFTIAGLRGNLGALVLVYIAQTVPVAIYMLRTYFSTIPVSLEEAAFIDGCSRWGVIRKISLPLAMPSVVATGLYVFMIAWNEFLFALLFLVERRDRWTVSLGLSQLSGSIEVPTTVLMAGSVVITIPVILLFFLAERALVEGLTAGAEKG
jgi:multiple sugar transport system permease protein